MISLPLRVWSSIAAEVAERHIMQIA